jgi:pyrroloquinoline quinone biosynthesis protein D
VTANLEQAGLVRERPVATLQSRPCLPSFARLRFNELRGQWVVLAPERVYWPDDVSVDILKLCDGTRTISDIAALLAVDYRAPAGTIAADILEFVQSWTDQRLLRI